MTDLGARLERGRQARAESYRHGGHLPTARVIEVLSEPTPNRPDAAEAKVAELTSDDMADRLALAAWQHDYPGRTLALPGARDLYARHYAPLGDALLAILRASAERTTA